jgi:hypothetical protein
LLVNKYIIDLDLVPYQIITALAEKLSKLSVGIMVSEISFFKIL